MSEHTSTPWIAEPCEHGGALLIRPISKGIYQAQERIQIVPLEDAQFIVKAVNSHEALVSALKAVLEMTDSNRSMQRVGKQVIAALRDAGEDEERKETR